MGNSRIEIMVGIFLVIGFCAFGWLSLRLGEVTLFSEGKTYSLEAAFNNVSGLKTGAEIQISGVSVGTVKNIAQLISKNASIPESTSFNILLSSHRIRLFFKRIYFCHSLF